MRFTYDVKKNKNNRIGYRIASLILLSIGGMQIYTLSKGYVEHIRLTILLVAVIIFYGLYLMKSSFRKQAYDITYVFSDEGMLVKHHYGETLYPYSDIDFITMVIPDRSMIFYMLNIKTKNSVYAIPFTNKKEYCESIYEFVNENIKKAKQETIDE